MNLESMTAQKTTSIRFVSGQIRLSEDKMTSTEELLRAGRFFDRRYGWFDVTPEMLLSMKKNFKDGTYGQEIFIDAADKPENGAAGTIRGLASDGNRLRADIEWTEFGIDAIRRRRMIYLSADYTENFQDNETGQSHGPLLMGAGLTIRPVIKHQKPIQLSEPDSPAKGPTLFNPEFVASFQENLLAESSTCNQGSRTQMADPLTYDPYADLYSGIKLLQETYDRRLDPSGRNLKRDIHPKNKEFAEGVLLFFDSYNAPRLLQENRALSGGSGAVSDTTVPAVFERAVIREALYSLNALKFVDAAGGVFAGAIDIPYSFRDQTAAGPGNTQVYEGQEIPLAGVRQALDFAYPIPQKLAFMVSDELRHLSNASPIQWQATEENKKNMARIIAEDTDQHIFNEMLWASDEFGAVAVSGENPGTQADGTKRVLLLANFPVVRPRTIYDLKGDVVTPTINPITVSYNGTQIDEYDGTGTQAPGTYYVLNYNLGEIYLVDESGAIQTPGSGVAWSVDYSYSTNTYNFDSDPGAAEVDAHWDTFLYRYALRIGNLEDQRFYRAEFGLMSGNTMTQIEQAKSFGANFRRPGTDLTETGDLGRVKDVPNWKVFGPGLWYQDHRVLIGQTGVTRFRMLKPWQVGTIDNHRGPNGRFTGQKTAYGDQWISIHTPAPLKAAYTSLNIYSASGRVARIDP